MKWQLRDYQQAAVDDAAAFLNVAKPGDRRLYASPTGTGKSVMELALLAARPGGLLITPRVEIAAGMLDKLGLDTSEMSPATLSQEAETRGIYTPIRLRNLMLAGSGPSPAYLVIDEAHHDTATTYRQLD